MQGHPRQMDHSEEFWENVVHKMEEEMANHSSILCLEPQEQWRGKKDVTSEDEPPRSEGFTSMLLGKWRGQLLIAPETMKQLAQSKKDSQLWMCPVVEGKSDAVKNNIA